MTHTNSVIDSPGDVAQLEAHVRDLTVQNTELTRRGSQTDQRSAQDQRLIEETEEALSLLRNEKLQWETQMESKSRQFAQLESRIKTLTTENAQLMEFKSGHRSEARHREERRVVKIRFNLVGQLSCTAVRTHRCTHVQPHTPADFSTLGWNC